MKTVTKIDPQIKIRKASDLLDAQPVVVRVNKFNEEGFEKFCEGMAKAHESGQPVIPVVVDSYGGSCYTMFGMVDQIVHARLPVATICEGKSMSAGAVLLSCGTEGYRYIGPHATVMIHEVSSAAFGKLEDLKIDVEEAERLNEMAMRLLATNCGKEPDYFLNLIEQRGHTDWYLNARAAKKHNLVNHVRLPELAVEVKVSVAFG